MSATVDVGSGLWRYYYSETGSDPAPPDWDPLSRLGSRGEPLDVGLGLSQLFNPLPPPPDWAQDLFRITRAVYLADKAALRTEAPDNWTRTLHLSIPAHRPKLWNTELLNRLLGFLTSDIWFLRLREGGKLASSGEWLYDNPRPSTVTLFSGGLDSLAFAVEQARKNESGDLVLVGHYDLPSLKRRQKYLRATVQDIARREVRFKPFNVNPFKTAGGRTGKRGNEQSTRSRSFMFMAAGILVAAAHRLKILYIPENGQLAINPPLTPARPGACSSRSAHPFTVSLFNELLSQASTDMKVENPYLLLTKGQVCQAVSRAGLNAEVLAETISCEHPGSDRSANLYRNCGYCFACLVRRSGLQVALNVDPTPYKSNPFADRTSLIKRSFAQRNKDSEAADVLALLRWLSADFGFRDLISNAPLPEDANVPALMSVIQRGREELLTMVGDVSVELANTCAGTQASAELAK